MPTSEVRERVRRAMLAQPRAEFLPPEIRDRAGADRALPIGFGATNSQPSTVRTLLEQLDPRPGQQVLDIGSGSGWTTAILGTLVGPDGLVLGLDVVPELVTRARETLASRAMPWVRIALASRTRLGDPDHGPWDRILVSADAGRVPEELTGQLAVAGRLVLPTAGQLRRIDRRSEGLVEHHVPGRWAFVPLQVR